MTDADAFPLLPFLLGLAILALWFAAFCWATRYRILEDRLEIASFWLFVEKIPFSQVVRARRMSLGDLLEFSMTKEPRLLRARRRLTSYFRDLIVFELQGRRIYVISPNARQLEGLRAVFAGL